MPPVLAQVNRDLIRTCHFARARSCNWVGLGALAGFANRGNVINVYTETNHFLLHEV